MPKILYVDDDVEMCHLMKSTLNHGQFQVVALSDPRQALDVGSQESFDILLTDYNMPWLNGLELIELLLEKQPRICPMIFSGAPPSTFIGAQVAGVIRKPADLDKIQEQVLQIYRSFVSPHTQQRLRTLTDRINAWCDTVGE